jgi:hypothetical protein
MAMHLGDTFSISAGKPDIMIDISVVLLSPP